MSANLQRPKTEPTTIPGPSGNLEALLDIPPEIDSTRAAVICHPHPQYGGTMTNKVVHMLAKSFNALGVPAVRFNYRGVGASAGAYDEGRGETDDAVAVLDWAAQRWPNAQLWAGGFSFGGAVAINAALQREVQKLVTVAPAIQRVAVRSDVVPRCPWLIVQGDRDELVDAEEIRAWASKLTPAPDLAMLPGVDHYFHGRLNDLRAVVLSWLEQDSNWNRT